MLKKFTAQNFNNELYTALDFTGSNAFLFVATDGDISVLKRFVQLLWASTVEDGVGLQFSTSSTDHMLTSTPDNVYLDNNQVNISNLEDFFHIKFSDYSKSFVITYTQLLNMELGRIPAVKYLNKYIFNKPDAKSYYSPIEDVFYDIEQAKKYNSDLNENDNEEEFSEINISQRISELKASIAELENENEVVEDNNDIVNKINELETSLENQRNQDSLLQEKEDLNRQIDILTKKYRSYEEAMEKISKVDIDINKHNSFTRLNPDKVEKDLSLFAYRIREREKIFSDISHKPHKYKEDHSHVAIMPLAVLIVLSLSFGGMLSILANVLLGLMIAFIFCTAIILYFIFARHENNQNTEETFTAENLNGLRQEIETLKSAKLRYLTNLGFNNEDDYFATKALVRALTFQKEDELTHIHELYDGKEISDFKVEIENIKNRLIDIQVKIDEFGPIMSPEDYIKKRRELDMLKLDYSSNNNSVANVSPEQKKEKINILRNQLKELQNSQKTFINPIDTYLSILKEYYGNNSIESDNDYIVKNVNVQNYEEKVEMMIIQRIAYIKSVYPNIELPVILEDPFVGVENTNVIKKILDFCADKLQIILISEHESYKDLGLKIINPE